VAYGFLVEDHQCLPKGPLIALPEAIECLPKG
jgi:hypothetical protein